MRWDDDERRIAIFGFLNTRRNEWWEKKDDDEKMKSGSGREGKLGMGMGMEMKEEGEEGEEGEEEEEEEEEGQRENTHSQPVLCYQSIRP